MFLDVYVFSSEKSELEQWNSRVDEMVDAIREAKEESKLNMIHFIRKPSFCICKNKDADQLHSNCAADQRHCFHYIDKIVQSLYFLNPKFQASSHFLWLHSPVCVGPGNPEDRFSRDAAKMSLNTRKPFCGLSIMSDTNQAVYSLKRWLENFGFKNQINEKRGNKQCLLDPPPPAGQQSIRKDLTVYQNT